MPAIEEIRRKIKELLDASGIGPIDFAKDLGIERNYISDFLKGRKRSLSVEVTAAIAEKLDIPLKDLTPVKADPIDMIRKGQRPHLYITEHMEDRNLDDEAMSRRMEGIAPDLIAKWRQASEAIMYLTKEQEHDR